jgi:RimJ/RimL family protein N-acetyltransferase
MPPSDPPIGAPVPGWTTRPRPPRVSVEGRYARLEPLDPARHGPAIHAANAEDAGVMWRYLPYGPFATLADWTRWAEPMAASVDPLFFAIVDRTTKEASGVAAFLAIVPEHGSVEVGHIALAPRLQRTRAATEAMVLMMRIVFDDLGYRRYEWKCDALNVPSRAAAQRLGFSYEGVFREHRVVKGHNRDSAWFAMVDADWPALRAAHEHWLDPANFDAAGRQRERLSELTGPILVARG